MRLRKVFRLMLFAAFFLWLHFWLRFSFGSAADSGGVCNQGGAFGFRVPLWMLFTAGMIGGVFLFTSWWRENTLKSEWPWILMLIGGSGNLLERMLFGCIMDYVILPGFLFFPVFNVADILLTIGVIGIFFNWYRNSQRNHEL